MTTSGKIYKIRSKKTGLWKRAGFYGGWNENGKAWSSWAALKGHISLYNDWKTGKPEINPDWEILEYDITVSEPKIITL